MWNCLLSSVLREGYTGKKHGFGLVFFMKEAEDLHFFDVEKKRIGKILYRAPFFSSSNMLDNNCAKTQLNGQNRRTGADKSNSAVTI